MVKVCLGDVAREFREICKEDIAKYPHVGLEHLDSGCIALSKWDSDKETTFTKKFYKGQILFGRRRAYLKKAVVAPFDGICSGDITVFEAIPSRIYPDYLPFIIQNDSFFDYAVGKSTGSLSRRAKWEFLKKYEFDLPSLEEQKRLADILWAAENEKHAIKKAIIGAKEYLKSYIELSLFDNENQPIPLKNLVKINNSSISAKTVSPDFTFDYIDIGSVTGPNNLEHANIVRYCFKTAPNRARRVVNEGDILMSAVRPNLQSFVIVPQGKYIASTGFIIMSPLKPYLRNIVFHSLFSPSFMQHCDNYITGSNYPAISAEDVGNFCLNLPSENSCILISKTLEKLQLLIDMLVVKEKVATKLLNQILLEHQ